jgi:hypothetical protein
MTSWPHLDALIADFSILQSGRPAYDKCKIFNRTILRRCLYFLINAYNLLGQCHEQIMYKTSKLDCIIYYIRNFLNSITNCTILQTTY